MVWALEEMQFSEEQNVLGGHMAALLGNFDQADELFSQSSQPTNALDVSTRLLSLIIGRKTSSSMSPGSLWTCGLERDLGSSQLKHVEGLGQTTTIHKGLSRLTKITIWS